MNENFVLALLDKFNASDAAELEIREGNFAMTLRKTSSKAAGGSGEPGDAAGGWGADDGAGAAAGNGAGAQATDGGGATTTGGGPGAAATGNGSGAQAPGGGGATTTGGGPREPGDAAGARGAGGGPGPAAPGGAAATAVDTAAGELPVTSPVVATFYASPGPDAPAFVSPGDRVKAGATLCVLEAMKMMNHLDAEFDCEVLRICAASGDLVEYGQTLFVVRRV